MEMNITEKDTFVVVPVLLYSTIVATYDGSKKLAKL